MENEEHYDFVIIGTGLSETAVSHVISSSRKYKILHLDTSPMYGSEFATLRYSKLEEHFGKPNSEWNKELLAKDKQFNIDLTPKLLLQDSRLKDFLVENSIHELVTFTAIRESYFFTDRLHTIPRNETQALRSSAVSIFQKPRVIRFFYNVRSLFNNGSTEELLSGDRKTMREEFQYYNLDSNSIDFIGHAICLNLDDSYLDRHPKETYDRIIRYVSSIVGFSNSESPYIYPHYGLSELCQAFARRSALNGTLFMLNADIKSIEDGILRVVDPDGVEHTIKAGKIISDPRYIGGSRVSKKIIRCIMILPKSRRNSRSIIFTKRSLKRNNDVFCVVLGAEEMACPPEYEIAILSTVQETDDPATEILPLTSKFDSVETLIEVRECYENDTADNIIFTRSVDESALMENIYDDIESVLKKVNMS